MKVITSAATAYVVEYVIKFLIVLKLYCIMVYLELT